MSSESWPQSVDPRRHFGSSMVCSWIPTQFAHCHRTPRGWRFRREQQKQPTPRFTVTLRDHSLINSHLQLSGIKTPSPTRQHAKESRWIRALLERAAGCTKRHWQSTSHATGSNGMTPRCFPSVLQQAGLSGEKRYIKLASQEATMLGMLVDIVWLKPLRQSIPVRQVSVHARPRQR